jgi:hypothetical protein
MWERPSKARGVVMFAALGVTLLAVPAVSDAQTRKGDFSCRASALKVGAPLNAEPVVANSSGPCEDELSQLNDTTVGPVTATTLRAETKMTPDNPQTVPPVAGDKGEAEAFVERAAIAVGPGISADVLRANAQVTCGVFHPTLVSSSSITAVTLGTQTINVSEQQAIPIPLLGFLRLNWTENAPGKVTRRALWLDLAPSGSATSGDPGGADVIIAEAVADYEGNPCLAAVPKPQCSDGIDNDGDGKTDYPADPGCTGPNDNNETDPPKPQCSDGIDNDGDGQTDYPADPGCSGPGDNDETDPPANPQCSDGIDNDGDGRIDFGPNQFHNETPATGCDGPDDNDERATVPQCSDGIDNDGDGRVDYGPNQFHDETPATGCDGPNDPDESS